MKVPPGAESTFSIPKRAASFGLPFIFLGDAFQLDLLDPVLDFCVHVQMAAIFLLHSPMLLHVATGTLVRQHQ